MTGDRISGEVPRPSRGLSGGDGTEAKAKVPGREPLRSLPKRFYASAVVVSEGGAPYGVSLDGRPLRTPGKGILALPVEPLAHAIAEEWHAQGPEIDPASMPLTRLANTALDGVAGNEAATRADIANYALSDLLCYRADAPADLARLQARSWDPVLAWAEKALGCRFVLAAGVMPVRQPEGHHEKMVSALEGYDAFALSALHVVTTLTGSALLALALARRHLTAEAVWAAAHVDEDYQIAQWGGDAEATARRHRRWKEMQAAAHLFDLVAMS